MNTLEYLNRLKQVKAGINQETAKTILKFEKQIVDLIREDQIFKDGEDGQGKIIGVYSTTRDKPFEHDNNRGYPKIAGTQVNLFDSGDLHKSFTTDYGSFTLEVFPTDKKREELIKKYGDSIFFMQVKNQEVVNFEIIGPQLQIFAQNTVNK